MSKKIFRETALERLSSPEQLDRMIRVTSPRGWMSLTALWAVVGAVIAWSFLGRVPTTEAGKGILIPTGGPQQVVAPSAGRLKAILVSLHGEVKVGDVVAEIDKQDLQAQLAQAELSLRDLRDRKDRLDASDIELRDVQQNVSAVERRELEALISKLTEKIAWRREYKASVAQLVADGMMTEIDVKRVQEEIEAIEATIEASRSQLEKLGAQAKSADAQRDRDRLNRQLEVDKAAREVELLRDRIQRESRIVSQVSGRIAEIRAAVNTNVAAGDPILFLQSARGDRAELTAVLYVKAGPGKSIKKGMEAFILPSTVKREEHGSIIGQVETVAEVPTSRSAMLVRLGDPSLVEQFVRDVGLPLEVTVSLAVDTTTTSGFKWTSGKGPPVQISEGTLCTGWITIKKQRPVSLVIPQLGDEG